MKGKLSRVLFALTIAGLIAGCAPLHPPAAPAATPEKVLTPPMRAGIDWVEHTEPYVVARVSTYEHVLTNKPRQQAVFVEVEADTGNVGAVPAEDPVPAVETAQAEGASARENDAAPASVPSVEIDRTPAEERNAAEMAWIRYCSRGHVSAAERELMERHTMPEYLQGDCDPYGEGPK